MSLLLAVIVTVEGQAVGLLMVTIASEHQLDAWRTLGLPGGRVMYNAGRDSYQRPETISLCFFFFFHGVLRPQKPYGLLGTGEVFISVCSDNVIAASIWAFCHPHKC